MHIYKGVYTQFAVHLEDFNFTDVSEVILTIKNTTLGDPIIIRKFTTATTVPVTISPAEAELVKGGAVYDFDVITQEGKRIKISPNNKVIVERGVGNVADIQD